MAARSKKPEAKKPAPRSAAPPPPKPQAAKPPPPPPSPPPKPPAPKPPPIDWGDVFGSSARVYWTRGGGDEALAAMATIAREKKLTRDQLKLARFSIPRTGGEQRFRGDRLRELIDGLLEEL